MTQPHSLIIQAGPRAWNLLQQDGLRAQDVAVIPAAAGGPKGLVFQHLDQWLFGHWLAQAPRERLLVGASIGAWRMAAACHADPVAAFARLSALYCDEQHYPAKPSPAFVSETCRRILRGFVGGHEAEVTSHPWHRLHIIAARGARMLAAPRRAASVGAGFALAALSNAISRRLLARHLQRVVIHDPRAAASWLRQGFDAFETHAAPLLADNLQAALLASGTLPFVMEPVRELPHAPPGTYWDGGLVDYHLALPYNRATAGLVLYPHFGQHIVPGWLDKQMPWRRAHRHTGPGWLDNVLLVSPAPHFLRKLPRQRLPDRRDFPHYGLEHARRISDWRLAIAEGERLRDDLAAFIEKPDMTLVQRLYA
ncbi:MAG: patatin-like phospholipase family protein [Paucimonas sp.]|nr:patatin-like phospholipase family protein [Paucimonas sp.]